MLTKHLLLVYRHCVTCEFRRVAAPFSALSSLSVYDSYDETLRIGTRFPSNSVQLSAILAAPNSDELLKDLATLVSHHSVVFFTDQDIEIEKQKELGTRLGRLGGNPLDFYTSRPPHL
ncbi:hypothetical protein B0H14DRAFT_3672467 [Mycena olivaceomarginata]|nr:hypothetical protein B0H14DRAFT_3672467 [Mycena olivaceomarginata]